MEGRYDLVCRQIPDASRFASLQPSMTTAPRTKTDNCMRAIASAAAPPSSRPPSPASAHPPPSRPLAGSLPHPSPPEAIASSPFHGYGSRIVRLAGMAAQLRHLGERKSLRQLPCGYWIGPGRNLSYSATATDCPKPLQGRAQPAKRVNLLDGSSSRQAPVGNRQMHSGPPCWRVPRSL